MVRLYFDPDGNENVVDRIVKESYYMELVHENGISMGEGICEQSNEGSGKGMNHSLMAMVTSALEHLGSD